MKDPNGARGTTDGPRDRVASVVVVEDERIVAKDIQQTLRGLGYDAFAVASSATEVLALVAERRPDVILMDIRIRGSRDGIDVAHELREKFNLPVIYLTAHADEGTLERARRTAPHGYLLKPVKSSELRIAIEIALYKEVADRQIRERDRWHQTTLESMTDAVVTVGEHGNISFMNVAAEGLLAATRAETVGFPVEDAIRLVDGSDGRTLVTTPEALRSLAKSRRPYLLRTGAGVREVRLKVDPVVERGSPLGFLVVLRDATEERKVQRQLELADRMSTVATMIAGLAAEVNNPLAILAANATFAEEELQAYREAARASESLAAARHEQLDQITKLVGNARTAGLRIAKLVADLRTFAQPPETGLERANVSLAVLRALEGHDRAIRERARLLVDLDEGLEATIDSARLSRLVSHLLANAALAIELGSPTTNEIGVTAKSVDGTVTIEVRDTGCGIPEDYRERVFEPFFTTREVGNGKGLGLSVCAGIVASARGRIDVASVVGVGTTMRVVLPTD